MSETNNKKTAIEISKIFLLMVVIQALRELIEFICFKNITKTQFTGKMVTMGAMIILTFVFVLFSKVVKVPLSVFPEKFSKRYITYSMIPLILFFINPQNYTNGIKPIIVLIYASVVTPIFEELIFRGYIWNKLNTVFSKEVITYFVDAILFMVWHIGYMIPQIIEGNWFAVLTKMAAGLGYGLILGFVRLKTKNCYLPILLHGVINMFMI